MAQLPPKAPSTPSLHFQMMMPFPSSTSSPVPHHSWVDEFLDFSATHRISHRRTSSDPIAFTESPFPEECRNPSSGGGGFERLDEEQLRSMFSDDVPAAPGGCTLSSSIPSSTNPSTPSEQDSEDDDKTQAQEIKREAGEVESSCTNQMEIQKENPNKHQPTTNSAGETIADPKRIKRILANRQSAQRSRVRKLQYISELERSVTALQNEVSALSPRVAYLDHQRLMLNVDNSALKQRIAALAQDNIFKDAHQEALRKEIERLRQIYAEQHSSKTMDSDNHDRQTTSNIQQDC